VLYSTISGLKGIAITDSVQFAIAMIGCIILAILVVNSDEVGGVENLKASLPSGALNFVPSIGNEISGSSTLHGFGLSLGAFFSFVAVQWWSSWYPGSEPGGGGYVAQRMMSTRNEKESVWATLLFQIGHYCVRPWPWIMVGLCAIVLYSPELNNTKLHEQLTLESSTDLDESARKTSAASFLASHQEITDSQSEKSVRYFYEPRLGFVFAMRDFLPVGLMGLLLTAFLAAYLSTISTQVNWGASYLVNDLLLPLTKESSNLNFLRYSRLASIAVMLAGAIATPFVTSISGVWEFIMQCGAGLGLVLILRWYWWRINAWSEISATIAPLLAYAFCALYLNEKLGPSWLENNGPFYFTVGFTTIVWIVVTHITPPPSRASIEFFDKRVRPMGVWPDYIKELSLRNQSLKWMFGGWFSMAATIVFTLFTIGKLILFETMEAMVYAALATLSAFGLRLFLKKTNILDSNFT
jgi:solute:Na+ symporter, SSS family